MGLLQVDGDDQQDAVAEPEPETPELNNLTKSRELDRGLHSLSIIWGSHDMPKDEDFVLGSIEEEFDDRATFVKELVITNGLDAHTLAVRVPFVLSSQKDICTISRSRLYLLIASTVQI